MEDACSLRRVLYTKSFFAMIALINKLLIKLNKLINQLNRRLDAIEFLLILSNTATTVPRPPIKLQPTDKKLLGEYFFRHCLML